MIQTKPLTKNKTYMGRLPHGADLLDALTQICIENDITLGKIEAIGAVKNACIGFYDQTQKVYEYVEYKSPMEILNLMGNVSLKDGKPIVHAHITLSDHDGHAHGGHLAKGTTVFACEYLIEAFSGDSLNRGFDQTTGLPLWAKDQK